jgi:hypothetical protein
VLLGEALKRCTRWSVSDRCASARLEIAANRLQEIEDYVREYAPHVAVPSWTEYLQLGDLGLYPKIMQSEYFFA